MGGCTLDAGQPWGEEGGAAAILTPGRFGVTLKQRGLLERNTEAQAIEFFSRA